MDTSNASTPTTRKRILLVAHCFDANFSMESRLSWMRATQAAETYDTTLICAEPFTEVACDIEAQIPGLRIVPVAHTAFEKALIRSPLGFYLAYRLWHWRVMQVAEQLHRRLDFSLVHQVSYCGYREPGYCWKLGVPFVWGPIGGTQNVPWKFLGQLDFLGAIREAARSVANSFQLRFGRRVGKALRATHAAFAANEEVQQSFLSARGVNLPRQLETGILQTATRAPELRSEERPIRLLWAGRLESWKALPLLLKAIAELPEKLPIEVRVLGSGSREDRWHRLAHQLGIADRIDWVTLPKIAERDEHYEWADVLAFTSLRDTSGTGLLEALAAGVPIIGLDHQGAKDIMTDDCAVRISVDTPAQTITEIRSAIVRLHDDPQLLQRLGSGALHRARSFQWATLGKEMLATYDQLLGETGHPRSDKLVPLDEFPDAEQRLSLPPQVTA